MPRFSHNLFKTRINTMIKEERETPSVHSHSDECDHSLDQRSNKVKQPKKQKQISKESQAKLSKQERAKIQKQKNRQAAQRSRDQHKEYVNNLEQEVKLLKEQIELNKRLCFKCQKELQNQDRYLNNGLQSDELSYQQHHIFEEIENPIGAEVEKQEVMNLPRDEDYFLRTNNQEEDNSYLKMLLFIGMVAMIVIGVSLSPSNTATNDGNRHLLEVYQSPISKPIGIQDFNIDINDPVTAKKNPEMFVDLNSGLVIRNSVINEQCLDSLIGYQPFSLTNLRTSHPSLGPQMSEGILLCSFQQQKMSFVPQSDGQSTFLKLFLMGAEIKEMITANSPIKKFIEANLQLNGIYRINAEVKQVELISHHNCLL